MPADIIYGHISIHSNKLLNLQIWHSIVEHKLTPFQMGKN